MAADPPTEALRAYVKLLRATKSVVARVEHRLAAAGLTVTQLGVLEALLHKGPLGQSELCRKVLTSAGNLTDVIDKLARRGLLRRTRHPTDRRAVRVELTECGRTLIEDLFPCHAADIDRAMAALDRDELRQLGVLLRRLGLANTDEPPHLAAEPFDIE